jgi:hypothetical protein
MAVICLLTGLAGLSGAGIFGFISIIGLPFFLA